MNPQVTVNEQDLRAFDAKLKEFIAQQRDSVPVALRKQGKLLAERVMSFTPPLSGKSLANTHGDNLSPEIAKLSALAVGKRRVKADINRLFLGMESMEDFDEVRAVIQGTESARLFVAKDGTVYGVERTKYLPDADVEDLEKHHERYRDKRGRVTEAGTKTRDVGRWRFVDKLAVPADVLRDYIRMKQAAVGQAKGGWAAAVRGLGGSPPQWVRKHSRAGSLTDGSENLRPFIEFENHSRWAQAGDDDRVIANAVRSRVRAMTSAIYHAQEQAKRKARV